MPKTDWIVMEAAWNNRAPSHPPCEEDNDFRFHRPHQPPHPPGRRSCHCRDRLRPRPARAWPAPTSTRRARSPSSAPGRPAAPPTLPCAPSARWRRGVLKQPIAVDNKAGAAGMIGAKAIAAAKPDGYTIGQIPISVTRFSQLGIAAGRPAQGLHLPGPHLRPDLRHRRAARFEVQDAQGHGGLCQGQSRQGDLRARRRRRRHARGHGRVRAGRRHPAQRHRLQGRLGRAERHARRPGRHAGRLQLVGAARRSRQAAPAGHLGRSSARRASRTRPR